MRIFLRTIASLVCVITTCSFAYAYVSPGNPTGYVNDFAGVLSAQTKQTLESSLTQFTASTTNQITVVTVPTIGTDETIETYAVKLFEEWKIGRKDVDNGVLFLIAVNDHQARIEVGYGLEGALPDSTSANILNSKVFPAFKQNNYDKGITDGVLAIEQATQGEYQSTTNTKSNGVINESLIEAVLMFLIIVGQIAIHFLSRSKSWWQGGVIGMVSGIVLGIFVFSFALVGTTILVIIFGILGFIIDYFLSKHGPFVGGGFGKRGGPFMMGGGFGSSRGGFGGFGGGSSGGGGASGGW